MEVIKNTASTTSRVAVIGASGYIGSNLVPKLVERGMSVRATARHLEVLQAREWRDVELAATDVLDSASLESALTGIDVAFYLVHCMRSGSNFEEMERTAATNFAAAAESAGVKRIIYLGGLNPPGAQSKHLISRRLTGDLLRSGRVPVTELRAGIIVGPGCASFEIIRDLVNHLPVMITPRWVRSKSPPIALENVLEYLIGVAEHDEAAGQIYDIAGPEMLSYEDLIRQYGNFVGKHPYIIAAPVLTPRLSSYWLRLVTAVPTSTARALIDGLKLHITADDSAIRLLVPQRLLSYRESIAAVFDTERRNAVAARWTEGALMYRDYNPDYAYYAMRDSASCITSANPGSVWRVLTTIGGDNRYFFANFLWTVREAIDWLVGGPGRNHGRRNPTELRIGDIVDSWRVIGIENGRRLTLGFGMKAPGSAVLEFEVLPHESSQSRITVTAYWHPAGALGIAYWTLFKPSHFIVFNGMVRAIAKRAEQAN